MISHPNRTKSFLIIALCYVAAALLGAMIFQSLPTPIWLSLLYADLVSAIFIWIASLLLGNISIHDPYWSIQPQVILILTLIYLSEFDLGSLLLVCAVSFWGIRLSFNWITTFPGLHQQDWRYDQVKQQTKWWFFPFVNLFAIQIMPTLIVFACLLPGIYYLVNGGGINAITILGLILIIGGAVLEWIADDQMQTFHRQHKDRTRLLRSGLWRYARHPNYLGEITVWWGVYVVMLSVNPEFWYLGIGALLNTCLFLFISIPLAEDHLAAYKADYEAYKQETRMLLPFPKRKQ